MSNFRPIKTHEAEESSSNREKLPSRTETRTKSSPRNSDSKPKLIQKVTVQNSPKDKLVDKRYSYNPEYVEGTDRNSSPNTIEAEVMHKNSRVSNAPNFIEKKSSSIQPEKSIRKSQQTQDTVRENTADVTYSERQPDAKASRDVSLKKQTNSGSRFGPLEESNIKGLNEEMIDVDEYNAEEQLEHRNVSNYGKNVNDENKKDEKGSRARLESNRNSQNRKSEFGSYPGDCEDEKDESENKQKAVTGVRYSFGNRYNGGASRSDDQNQKKEFEGESRKQSQSGKNHLNNQNEEDERRSISGSRYQDKDENRKQSEQRKSQYQNKKPTDSRKQSNYENDDKNRMQSNRVSNQYQDELDDNKQSSRLANQRFLNGQTQSENSGYLESPHQTTQSKTIFHNDYEDDNNSIRSSQPRIISQKRTSHNTPIDELEEKTSNQRRTAQDQIGSNKQKVSQTEELNPNNRRTNQSKSGSQTEAYTYNTPQQIPSSKFKDISSNRSTSQSLTKPTIIKRMIVNKLNHTESEDPQIDQNLAIVDEFIETNKLNSDIVNVIYNIEDEEFIIKMDKKMSIMGVARKQSNSNETYAKKFKMFDVHGLDSDEIEDMISKRKLTR